MNEIPKLPPGVLIPSEDWEQTPASVRAVVLMLYQQVGQLEVELAELKEKVNRNSRNSSQPPSSDRPDQQEPKRKPQGERKRRRGGQSGHKGHKRELVPVEQVDEIVPCKPEQCAGCGTVLEGEDPEPYRYQTVELPPVKAVVTEYQVHTLQCECGTVNRGELPQEAVASQFGPNLVGLIAILMGVYRLSKRKTAMLLEDCFGIKLSTGSVVNQQNAVSEALAAPVEEAGVYVQTEAVRNIDETGWPQRDQEKRGWLWVVVTPLVTVFAIALSRAGQVAKDLLDPESAGAVGSDRYSAYTWLKEKRWQVCWSHLLRDFQKILERDGASQPIGETLRAQGERLLQLWGRVRDGTLSHADFLTELPAIQTAVHQALTEGAACSHPKTAKTCRNLLDVEPALWTFTEFPGLEPTNNSAERALRHAVIWRRTSYGTQSDAGSRFVERMLTTVETCRQQGRNPLDYVREALVAHRAELPIPSLLPASLPQDDGAAFVTL
jgi:hypothetical protein